MPILAILIGPLLALYIKYKIMQYTVKLILFMAVYMSFKQGMQFVINTVMGKMMEINFPCSVAYILNGLDIFSMINFALSLWATIYIGRFFYNTISKFLS